MEAPTRKPPRAYNACAFCKHRKRKCDRQLPACTNCVTKKVKCLYPDESEISGISQDAAVVKHLEYTQVAQHSSINPSFPAVFYLDPKVFRYYGMEVPSTFIPLPPSMADYIGDVRQVATTFFENIHGWMPIISKRRIYDRLLNPLMQPRTDTALLIYSMKLIASSPSEKEDSGNPRTAAYLNLKRFLLEAEMAGILSLCLLQAGILVTFYEVGHAIYPSAYTSLGAWNRYALSLGINGKEAGFPSDQINWVEEEERRRAWWAILILDRVLNLGNPERPLSTQDPGPDTLLPIDDSIWDQGTIPPEVRFTISTPPSHSAGRFARLAQATYLLGKVLMHTYDSVPDEAFYKEEATQLDRTIRALLVFADAEDQAGRTTSCAQTAVCFSALLILYNGSPASYETPHSLKYRYPRELLKQLANDMAGYADMFLYKGKCSVDTCSPLLFYWIYQAICIYSQLPVDDKTFGTVMSSKLKERLQLFDYRWKAAGAYAQILEARNMITLGMNT